MTPMEDQKRLVIVGATGMLGGYPSSLSPLEVLDNARSMIGQRYDAVQSNSQTANTSFACATAWSLIVRNWPVS